ncbi:MAG: polyphenol oxidase family protein [Candidatus Dojkabacteria bacterium]|nr:polyphenol oxidase family protein [Candidatus Dojkabacteria bacterium]
MNILDYVRIETSTVEDGNMSYTYGDDDEVLSNKLKFWEKSNFKYKNTYQLKTNIKEFDRVEIINDIPKDLTVIDNTDSLITSNPNIVLALLTADCLQIIAYDRVNKVLALIHSGFKWQDAGIIDKTLNVMHEKFETNVENIFVYLGDCISKDFYRWDEGIFNNTNENSWIRKTLVKDNHPTHPYLIDLRKSAILNLRDLGIKEENILDTKTDCYSNDKYFSHVRSLNQKEKDGRHITLVQMK